MLSRVKIIEIYNSKTMRYTMINETPTTLPNMTYIRTMMNMHDTFK